MVTLGNDSLTAQRLGICPAKFKVESATRRFAFRVHSAKLARLQNCSTNLFAAAATSARRWPVSFSRSPFPIQSGWRGVGRT